MRSDYTESGGTIAEYGLVGAFGSVVAITGMALVGEKLKPVFETVANALSGVVIMP